MKSAKPFVRRPLIGTFLSEWLVASWDDALWEQELSAMQEIGMRYLILAPTVYRSPEGKAMACYATAIPSVLPRKSATDVVESLLRNARKFGMKVFLGLNMDDLWWKMWWDTRYTLAQRDWLTGQMHVGNQVAQELYQRYHTAYPDTFYGWYWVWEFWNTPIMALKKRRRGEAIQLFADVMNVNLDYLSALNPSMPLLFSPFANMTLTDDDDLYHMWKDIFSATRFRDGDIFCPQDSIGAGGTKLPQLRSCYAAYKRACDTKPELRFWSNNENFEASDWSSAFLDRFVEQMEVTGEFSEENITFAYNNYYSPVNVGRGFHDAYRHYLESGSLDFTSPDAPQEVVLTESEGHQQLSWSACHRAAAYQIFKNGKAYGSVKQGRNDGKGYVPPMPCHVTVDATDAEYAVAAISWEGVSSPATHAVLS